MRNVRVLFLAALGLAAFPAAAQTGSGLGAILDQLQRTAQTSVSDVQQLRIEKWKTDGATKRASQADADALQRNMTSALPELIAKLRSTPNDLNANFKLYRNVDVLYDVFVRFAETAGAFGPKEEYELLARDLNDLQSVRRFLADNLEALTSSAQGELDRLRAQIRAAQQAAAAPPKRVIVDDTETPKSHKKKPASTSHSTTSSQKTAKPSPTPAKPQ